MISMRALRGGRGKTAWSLFLLTQNNLHKVLEDDVPLMSQGSGAVWTERVGQSSRASRKRLEDVSMATEASTQPLNPVASTFHLHLNSYSSSLLGLRGRRLPMPICRRCMLLFLSNYRASHPAIEH